MKMKRILFSLFVSLILLVVSVGNGMAQTPPAIDVNVNMTNTDLLLNVDPITIDITLENTGADDLIVPAGFSGKDFSVLLTFIDSDGRVITANAPAGGPFAEFPAVIPVDVGGGKVELLQVDPVELLMSGVSIPIPSFDARTIYDLVSAGNYSVKAKISIRTYPAIFQTVDGVDYAEQEPVDFQGFIESNTVNFSLSADADGDGYYYPVPHGHFTDVDCDDTDAAVNPGVTEETVGNGKDDDCDPATSDVPAIDTGTINIKADKHTVGSGSHPGSTKESIGGMAVRAYDKTTNECVSYFGVSWQYYESNWGSTCLPAARGVTGADGTVSLEVEPGNYIVIGKYDPDPDNVEPIYIGVSARGVDSDTTTYKYLQVIEKVGGKKVPAKYTTKTGSELLIIEPEYVEWDGTEELYPFVFESLGDWAVTTSVSPPEGFVADYVNLTEDVNTELEAVQFTITDIGSKWVDTECTHDITHKGKKEKIKSKIGVKLSRKLAKAKGLDRFGKEEKK